METLGNTALLNRHRIGFMAGSKSSPLSVLPSIDWAAEIARHDDVAIVSGFHSQLERQVLDFLLDGKCGIICVLARSIYKKVPPKFLKAFNDNRVLFISHCNNSTVMASRILCRQRNEYVASISDELVFSSLTPDSSLYEISLSVSPVTIL